MTDSHSDPSAERSGTEVPSADSPSAEEGILGRVYAELRSKAQIYLQRENAGHTLQPTALVHEAWFRLVEQTRVHWKNEGHFMAVAAQSMRRILVDHARKRMSLKRGGDRKRVDLDSGIRAPDAASDDLLLIDGGLDELRAQSERLAETVELKVFTGLSSTEIAEIQGLSKRTVEREWRVAQAWLRSYMSSHREG